MLPCVRRIKLSVHIIPYATRFGCGAATKQTILIESNYINVESEKYENKSQKFVRNLRISKELKTNLKAVKKL